MYGNVDDALLWLRLLYEYLIKEREMKIIHAEYCILYKKYDSGKLELVISINVDNECMEARPEKLENIKEIIKLKFNIKESDKLKKFLGVYYKWGHDAKGTPTKITTEKDINILVDGYKKFTGSDVKVKKIPSDPGTNLSKSKLKDPIKIYKYRPFLGHIMWYNMKVRTGVSKAARELDVHMSHTWPDNWNSLGSLIGYLNGKDRKGITTRKPKVI